MNNNNPKVSPMTPDQSEAVARDGEPPLMAAAREAGWALMENVDVMPWERRGQVRAICERLGAALALLSEQQVGEDKGSARADLSRASPSPDQHSTGSFDAAEFLAWFSRVREWSGSAFLAGEKMTAARQLEAKGALYSDLCSLGNYLSCWADMASGQEGSASVIGSSDERSVHAEPLPAPPPEQQVESGRLRDVWSWLSERINLELSWGDPPDAAEGDPCAWLVYRVSGNRNDREWEFVSQGTTALEAVEAAREALSPSPARAECAWQRAGTEPAAVTVSACRFDADAGEWVYAYVLTPLTHPFTHWQHLAPPPAHAEGGQ